MYLPKLNILNTTRQMVDEFRGYNHTARIGDGEFFDMRNMTSTLYPLASPRKPRGVFVEAECNGMVINNGLCYVSGSGLVLVNKDYVDAELKAGPKTLVSMGGYVIILPDKKWVNVAAALGKVPGADTSGSIEVDNEYEGGGKVYAAMPDGRTFPDGEVASTKPSAPTDGQYWRDYSVFPAVLKRWYASSGMWVEVSESYAMIEIDGIGDGLEVGDSVHITGDFEGALELPEYTQVYWIADDKSAIVVAGFVVKHDAHISTEETPIVVQRKIPDMDFVIECGNRLWGCKYGETENGFVNEIYCSKLGDFKNWHSFKGISTDSYVASIGAGGPFTGAVNYNGKPYFFKQDCVIEVYGSYPAEFQVQTTPCRGVQGGCSKSLAVVGNVLYYKSIDGVCAFDGSMPSLVSNALGTVRYTDAVGGAFGDKYYLCMNDENGDYQTFVLDTARGMWHKDEEGPCYTQILAHGNMLYATTDGWDIIVDMLGVTNQTETVEWMLQTGDIGLNMADAKYITRLTIRMALDEGSEVSVYCQYDFDEAWELLCSIPGTSLRSFNIPIKPKRCDHMRLRIEGVGDARIYSITKTIEQGGERA